MSDSNLKPCPITGDSVEARPLGSEDPQFGESFVHPPGRIDLDNNAIAALGGGLWRGGSTALSTNEMEMVRCLLRSRIWRAKRTGPFHFVLTGRTEIEALTPTQRRLATFFAIEDVLEEAKSLTMRQKIQNTLINLYDQWANSGEIPRIPYHVSDSGASKFRTNGRHQEDGMAYGCDERFATKVYECLLDEGLLRSVTRLKSVDGLDLTAKAIEEVERLRAGLASSLNRGFFIRRFDPEMDSFYKPIMETVKRKTGCDVAPVWDPEKNAKLDELILRNIRESSVIVLDVTGERFNVGLEAGYALALRKQIIVLRDREDCPKDEKSGEYIHVLPFDLRTMNCFFYSKTDPDALQQKLVTRIWDALEEVRNGTH